MYKDVCVTAYMYEYVRRHVSVYMRKSVVCMHVRVCADEWAHMHVHVCIYECACGPVYACMSVCR